jgi:hypothetical protein
VAGEEPAATAFGKIAALHKEVGRLQRDLAKVDGVIQLFDPSYRVGSTPPKGARQRANLFKQGELGRIRTVKAALSARS